MIPLTFSVQAEPLYGHERHSEIRDALHALDVAKHRLEEANHLTGNNENPVDKNTNAADVESGIIL